MSREPIFRPNPGPVPGNAIVETREERIRQLKAKALSLPEDSTSRANIERILRDEYKTGLDKGEQV